jgi:protein-disulfide isomerase
VRPEWKIPAAAVLAAALLAVPVAAAADEKPVSQGLLAALPELSDIVEGSRDAPSTIIEYASLTCTHCAAFHTETWPQLKAKYVDAGKVKFILREFPLDPRAAAGFLLARCAGPDNRDAVIDALFDRQNAWAFVGEPVAPLRAIMAPFGVAGADFDACVQNETLYREIGEGRDNAMKALDIRQTPTFYINGWKLVGEAPIEAFDALLAREPN